MSDTVLRNYNGRQTKSSFISDVLRWRPGEGKTHSTTNNNGILGAVGGPKLTNDSPAMPEAARWHGWGTALKPAHEPIVVGRKPLAGTVAAGVLEYGVGALNIDGCRGERASDGRFEYGVDGDEQPTTGASGIYGKFAVVTGHVNLRDWRRKFDGVAAFVAQLAIQPPG